MVLPSYYDWYSYEYTVEAIRSKSILAKMRFSQKCCEQTEWERGGKNISSLEEVYLLTLALLLVWICLMPHHISGLICIGHTGQISLLYTWTGAKSIISPIRKNYSQSMNVLCQPFVLSTCQRPEVFLVLFILWIIFPCLKKIKRKAKCQIWLDKSLWVLTGNSYLMNLTSKTFETWYYALAFFSY